MKERPILFSAPMVRALLAGTKTQTRRPVKPQPHSVSMVPSGNHLFDYRDDLSDYSRVVDMKTAVTLCPHGQPGDRLWVREAWAAGALNNGDPPSAIFPDTASLHYLADGDPCPLRGIGKGRRSFHMPRWASRITLEITSVRIERLHDISEADARAEGITPFGDGNGWHTEDGRHYAGTAADAYLSLWAGINGEDSARANPWVWVIEFKRLTT